jgi:hypothetical protein
VDILRLQREGEECLRVLFWGWLALGAGVGLVRVSVGLVVFAWVRVSGLFLEDEAGKGIGIVVCAAEGWMVFTFRKGRPWP